MSVTTLLTKSVLFKYSLFYKATCMFIRIKIAPFICFYWKIRLNAIWFYIRHRWQKYCEQWIICCAVRYLLFATIVCGNVNSIISLLKRFSRSRYTLLLHVTRARLLFTRKYESALSKAVWCFSSKYESSLRRYDFYSIPREIYSEYIFLPHKRLTTVLSIAIV